MTFGVMSVKVMIEKLTLAPRTGKHRVQEEKLEA